MSSSHSSGTARERLSPHQVDGQRRSLNQLRAFMPHSPRIRGSYTGSTTKTPGKAEFVTAVVRHVECRSVEDRRLGVVGGIGGGDSLALPLSMSEAATRQT